MVVGIKSAHFAANLKGRSRAAIAMQPNFSATAQAALAGFLAYADGVDVNKIGLAWRFQRAEPGCGWRGNLLPGRLGCWWRRSACRLESRKAPWMSKEPSPHTCGAGLNDQPSHQPSELHPVETLEQRARILLISSLAGRWVRRAELSAD
jgi:hypothetical protein